VVSDIGVRLTFDLDQRAIVVGLVLATASALLAGLLPAWRATESSDLTHLLRTGAISLRPPSRLWGRNGLVVGQVALSLVLLTVTVFLSRTFQTELSKPGFRTERILLAGVVPELAGYDGPRTAAFYELLRERAGAIPGVTSVGMTSVMPLNQDSRESVFIVPEGFQLPPGTQSLSMPLDALGSHRRGLPRHDGHAVVRGRGIRTSDASDTPRVLLVNQAMAARYWPGEDPVGRRIRLMSREGQPWAEVVGVTADNKYNWIGEAPTPWMYLALRQDQGPRATLLIASRDEAAALAAPLRTAVADLDPNMPITGLRTMEEYYYGNATGIVTALLQITASMGVMGLALAMVGLYGLVAFAAARRTREIGIRMAVGARPASVLRMVLRHALALATWGAVIGVLGSVAAGGLLRSAFPSTGGIDVATYLLVVPALVVVMLLGAYLPARRASRLDPLAALRQE
jgi:predicted permease